MLRFTMDAVLTLSLYRLSAWTVCVHTENVNMIMVDYNYGKCIVKAALAAGAAPSYISLRSIATCGPQHLPAGLVPGAMASAADSRRPLLLQLQLKLPP